jgi:GT2 family glycosyltransferase
MNDERKTFLETQNIMRQYAIDNKFDWYSFMHNDAEVIEGVHRLVTTADTLISNNTKFSVIFTHYDVLCAFSTEAVKYIGLWGDERWPKQQLNGYYLDNDYYNRMKLSDYTLYQLEKTHVLHNEPSNTLKNATESRKWAQLANIVGAYYKRKWGNIKVPNNIINIS